MVKFYDISQWEEHQYFGTGGTRDKIVVENPEDRCLYYFKTSYKKEVIDYKYEFWSEIIASEIGSALGINILHYDVAWKDTQLGCLSKSMINPDNEELQEGYKWLTGYYPEYDILNKDAYTFQIIERLLKARFPNKNFIRPFIETIVFDAIIGNGDRHQENWGIIISQHTSERTVLFGRKKSITEPSYVFAPIYDSGSSLGRELTDTKVSQVLMERSQLEAYVNRGQAEVRWENESGKHKHLDLILKIVDAGYKDEVKDIIAAVQAKFSVETISDIINTIDDSLPAELSGLKIPRDRKDFIIKLVSLRVDKLLGLQL